MTQKTATRSYRSSLRTEQAAETRRRVLDAAAACFSEKGYSGTSLADVGIRAGVSTETVKSSGPKRDLLLRAFEQAFAGAEGDAPIGDSDAGEELLRIADNDEFLAAMAAFIADANARTSVLWTELLSAANADRTIGQALTGLLDRRRREYRQLADVLLGRGIVRSGSDMDAAADTLSFLWSPESHQQLVLQGSWTMERYASWLADAVRRQFG